MTSLVAVVLVLVGAWWLRPHDRNGVSPAAAGHTASPADTAAPRAGEAARREPAAAPSATPSRAASDDHYDVEGDEALGGHTLARHVGQTDAQLRDRLAEDRGISTASTYTTQAVAERTVARALRAQADRVQAWTARTGNRPNLALDYHGPRNEVLGRSIRRGQAAVDCTDAVIVLRWNGRRAYVLTSYPESSR